MLFMVWIRRRILILTVCLVLCLILTGMMHQVSDGELLAAVEMVTKMKRIIPVYSVETQEKKLAISFDAAWGAEKTPEILEILKKHQVKTTFFLVDFWLEKYPEMAKRLAEEGHELQNHSATHPHMNSLSEEQIKEELMQPHRTIEKLTGQKAWLFRPPFGEYSNKVIQAAQEVGYTTIIWDVDSLDWKDLSAEEMTRLVLSKVHPGAIVLFHNNGLHTPQAVDRILTQLKADGYQIVPISQLVMRENYHIDHAGVQRPIKKAPGE